MEEDKKNIIKLVSLMILYILLGATGIFGQVEVALLPFLSIPFAILCVKHQISGQWQAMFHVAVGISIYLVMDNVLSVVIYLISVILPAYIILYLYQQMIPLPNMMMYGGLILSVLTFAYFSFIKSIGLDFEAYFNTIISFFDNEIRILLEDYYEPQIINTVHASLQTLRMLYPTVIIMQVLLSFSLTVIIVNGIINHKGKSLPSNKEIFNFRLSKLAVVILLISMIGTDLSDKVSPEIFVLALNLTHFLIILFEIVGLLSLLALLWRNSLYLGLKILGCIAVLLLFIVMPQIFMIFGCLDSIFNYRNIYIVV